LNGRIIKGVGGLYSVDTNDGIYFCKPRGIFRNKEVTPLVGDYVHMFVTDERDREGVIDEILARKNEFIRPRACNIDLVILVFAVKEPAINFDLLDRFIILAEAQNLEVLICINKMDLVIGSGFEEFRALYEAIGYKVKLISTFDNCSKNELIHDIRGQVSILAGPSGVGKSSIVNLFQDNDVMETGELSQKNKRGKHTTRHAELIEVEKGTFIVDSPGFTSVNLNNINPQELQFYFKEFGPYLNSCKFNDCMHINEPGCLVKSNINVNINEQRYNRYKYFLDEILKWRK
jgi:ribosome biogenesis GTPase